MMYIVLVMHGTDSVVICPGPPICYNIHLTHHDALVLSLVFWTYHNLGDTFTAVAVQDGGGGGGHDKHSNSSNSSSGGGGGGGGGGVVVSRPNCIILDEIDGIDGR